MDITITVRGLLAVGRPATATIDNITVPLHTDLLNDLINWYDDQFGPDPEDVAGAVIAIEPIIYAASVVLGFGKESARQWVKDELNRVHQNKSRIIA